MINNIKADKATVNNDASSHCGSLMATLQLATGLLLVTATAFAYSLMQHPAMMIPCLMGAALLFQGTKALLVCRNRTVLRDHHHPSTG